MTRNPPPILPDSSLKMFEKEKNNLAHVLRIRSKKLFSSQTNNSADNLKAQREELSNCKYTHKKVHNKIQEFLNGFRAPVQT